MDGVGQVVPLDGVSEMLSIGVGPDVGRGHEIFTFPPPGPEGAGPVCRLTDESGATPGTTAELSGPVETTELNTHSTEATLTVSGSSELEIEIGITAPLTVLHGELLLPTSVLPS